MSEQETTSETRNKILRADLRAIRKAAEELEIAIVLAKSHGLESAVHPAEMEAFHRYRVSAQVAAMDAHQALVTLKGEKEG